MRRYFRVKLIVKLRKIKKICKKTSKLVRSVIIHDLRPISDKVKIIAFDNNFEFSQHTEIDEGLKSKSYFADPFSKYQRRSKKNMDGLIRQYISKKRSLSTILIQEHTMMQDRLSNQ